MGADVAGDARLLAAQRRVAAARAEGDAALDEALVELHRLYAELRSHDEARTISGELVELWRGGASEVALAKALTLHAIDWRRAVGYPQAIEAASEAIELYDALAQPLERAVGESLARALECLAGSLAILRRDAESLAARERLAATLQTIGAPRERVADVLCDLATSQRRHGTLAGEVQARRQAIAVLRPLTEEDPERHGAALLEALSALEQTLKHAGSSESALAQRERLETLERLARHDLARYGDHLLAAYDAAPPRTDEDPSAWRRTLSLRVQLTRSLAERWPARYTPRRVQALLEQGATLREACFVEDALAPALEAMLLLEQLAVHEYDAEGSWLVDALVECGTLLWRLERWDASLSMRSAAIDVLGARGRREDRTRAVELRFDYAEELLLAERYEDAVAVGREAMAALRGCCDVRTPELRDLTAGLVRLGELERMAGHGAAASSSFREVAALVRALVEQHDDDGDGDGDGDDNDDNDDDDDDDDAYSINVAVALAVSGAAAYKGLAAVLLEEGAHAEAAAELRMSVEILRALVEHSPRQHFADFAAAVHALVMACRGAPASIDDAAELLSLTRQSHELLRSELRRAPYIEVIDYLEALADLLALAVEPKDRAEALSDAALFAATALASVAWVHRPRSLRARALALDRIAEELRAIGRSDLASAYGEASRRCRSRS